MTFFRVDALPRRVAAAAAVLLAFGAIAGCAPADKGTAVAKKQTPTLTASKAGEKYLSAVCPANSAWQNAEVEIDALRLQVSRGEASTERITQVFTSLSAKLQTAKDALADTSEKWPKKASEPVAAVAASLQQDITQLNELLQLPAAKIAGYTWQGGEEAAEAAKEAREALGITGSAEESCAAWLQKHKAEQEAKKSRSKGSKLSEEADSASATGQDADGAASE